MFENREIRLGIVPIGWTNDDMWELGDQNTFEQCISEIRLAGFRGCEVGHKFPTDLKVLKKALDLRSLTISSKWFSSFLGTRPYEEVREQFIKELEFLSAMGAGAVNISEQSYSIQGDQTKSIFDEKAVLTDDEFSRMCEGLNKLGELANSYHIRASFHHHMGTCVQTLEETRRLLDQTEKGLVYLCYDTGHWVFTETDPLEILHEYPDRIGNVHLKNMRKPVRDRAIQGRWPFLKAVREGCFTVPGDPEGCVDFPAIFRKLDEIGYEGWIIVEAEQDPAKANPFEYAKMAYEFMDLELGLDR
ncbi:MAG: myo-inosose-2 dehydratase [Eubacterium sp.]|nr:myo-inosose-2 dehydratase [Eubacterium sp.]